ncbi:MAG: DNA cytosine methyltransferase [Nostocales cyanobacterium 94392]|nr:DNA cytosine methyltransferase [Nostocales cyanobacterium 94392]
MQSRIDRKLLNLKAIDIFAGCGGLSLGFENAGFTIIAAFDNWEPAIQVYQKNFSHPIYNCDLSNLNDDYSMFDKIDCDIVIGGPPCQDFSSAGKRNENLGRGDLSIIFAKIITLIKPQWFVMENVERYKKSAKRCQVVDIFKANNYGLTEIVIKASLCGVPQNRKRYICIGKMNGKDDELLPYINKNLAENPMSVRDYLGDSLGIEYYYRHPRTYARRGIFSIDEPSPTIRGVNRPIPKTYKLHQADASSLIKEIRPLTTIERSYIQTFPKNFNFDIKNQSKTDLEQMIGNAVPVKLAEYIANSIIEYIESTAIPQLEPRQLVFNFGDNQ